MIILFTKTWNKMVQKGVFFTVCHTKRGILFQLWDHQIRVFFRGADAYQSLSAPPPPTLECSDWDVVNQSNGTQLDGILRSWNFDDATSGLWWRQIFGLIPHFTNKLTCPGLKQIFKTVLGNKMFTSGSGNGRYFKRNRVNPINLYIF